LVPPSLHWTNGDAALNPDADLGAYNPKDWETIR